MRRKKIILILSALLFISSACTSHNDYSSNDALNLFQKASVAGNGVKDSGPANGGELNLFSTRPDTLNPLLTKNVYVKDFLGLIYESLFKLDRDQKAVPVLAEEWEVSDDGLIWTFKIRSDVQWHDGMPLTADDIIFTIKTLQNGNIDSVYKSNVKNIAAYAIVSRNTFSVFLNEPDSFLKERLTFPILPSHYFIGENIEILNSEKNMTPMGTGPYCYSSGSGTNNIKLISNGKWWNSEDREKPELSLPYITDINIRIFDSERDAIDSFHQGEIDVMPVSTGNFAKYSRRTDINFQKYTGNEYEFIAINLKDPVLSDKTVRKAIAMAIDKNALIDEIIPGEAIAADIPIIPNTWLNDSSLFSYTTDREKARDLLVQNGWKEESGVMHKNIDGKRKYLQLELLVNNYNDTRMEVVMKISEQLKEIGVDVSLVYLDWEEVMDKVRKGEFHLAFMGCRVSSIPDISFAYASEEAYNGFNVSGYSNPLVDMYLKRIRKEKDDEAKKALYMRIRNIVSEDVPYIGLYFYNDSVLYSKRIKGEVSPYLWDKYNNIVKWYIPIAQ